MQKLCYLLLLSGLMLFGKQYSQASNRHSVNFADNWLTVVIGTQGQFQHPEAFRMPVDFHWQSSLSQSLYYPGEIGISRGMINALTYYTNFQQNLPGKEIMIWMGETETDNIYNGWIDPAGLELVFDGEMDFPSGENVIDISLDTPYEYNGGKLVIYFYRVWDTDYYGWGNRFYTTRDEGVYRTRQVNEDNPVLDPMNPSMASNWRVDYYPTVGLQFPLDQLGGLEGYVSHNDQVLEGVEVSILGTTAVAITDQNGYYSIPHILADSYDIRFSLEGFASYTAEDFQIEAGQTNSLDVSLAPVQTYSVGGLLIGNDDIAIEDASITLSGEYSFAASTGTSGYFSIENVPQGNYLLSISAAGYESLSDVPVMVSNDDVDLGTIVLDEIIITPLLLTADADTENNGEVMLTWYHGESSAFRHDAGFTYWIAVDPADINTIFATKFTNEAVITQMQWYLTAEVQSHPLVKVWVFGLDENGNPDRDNILYQKENVPNNDDDWTIYEFEEPVLAENGFLVGVSAPNGIYLGTDSGESPDWPFQSNTHFLLYTDDDGNDTYMTIEPQVQTNLNLRAYGLDLGELEFKNRAFDNTVLSQNTNGKTPLLTKSHIPSERETHYNSLSNESLRMSIVGKAYGYRILEGYNVFLQDMDSPYAFTTETNIMISNLEEGDYIAGVQAVYTSALSDIVATAFYTEGADQGEAAGTSCENPYFISLPLVDFQNTTTDKGNNYASSGISPPSFFIDGNDMVFQFTVEASSMLTGSMTADGSFIGVFVMQDCPDPDNPALMTAWATSYGNSLTLPSSNPNQPQEILLTPGDYFLIVSSYPPPQSIDFTLNLALEPYGGCTAPIILTANNITEESAELGWTATGNEDAWNILWGAAGFDPENEGTFIENVTESPYTLTGLDAGETYEFYVQAICDDDQTSDWAGPKAFTTECDIIITAPFTEGFESETAPPDCWAVWYANPATPSENLAIHTTEYAYAGQRSFRFSSEVSAPPHDQTLRTPRLGFNADMDVSFHYRTGVGATIFAVGTSENGNDWTWGDDISANNFGHWETYSMVAPASAKYIAIKFKGPFMRKLFIDKFSISVNYTVNYEIIETNGETNGSLTAEMNGQSVNPGDQVPGGSDVTFTATPNAGYKLKEWTINGDVILENGETFTDNVLFVENITEHLFVTVEFEEIPKYTLTLVSDPQGAGALTGDGAYEAGTEITVTATANAGYLFINWTDESDDEISAEPSFTFTMPSENRTLTANFDIESFVSQTEEGTEINVFPNPAGQSFTVSAGEEIQSILVSDITGNIVFRANVNATQILVTTSLEVGAYIIRVNTASGSLTRKLLIQ